MLNETTDPTKVVWAKEAVGKAAVLLPSESAITRMVELAKIAASSGMKGVPSWQVAFLKIAMGAELGLPWVASIGVIDWVDSKEGRRLAMNSMCHVAIVRRSGKGDIRLVETSATKAVAEVHRNDWPAGQTQQVTFTAEQAVTAELMKKATYKAYPQSMLAHRCQMLAVKLFFAELVLGLGYDADELGAETDENGRPLGVEIPEAPSSDDNPLVAFMIKEIDGIPPATQTPEVPRTSQSAPAIDAGNLLAAWMPLTGTNVVPQEQGSVAGAAEASVALSTLFPSGAAPNATSDAAASPSSAVGSDVGQPRAVADSPALIVGDAQIALAQQLLGELGADTNQYHALCGRVVPGVTSLRLMDGAQAQAVLDHLNRLAQLRTAILRLGLPAEVLAKGLADYGAKGILDLSADATRTLLDKVFTTQTPF